MFHAINLRPGTIGPAERGVPGGSPNLHVMLKRPGDPGGERSGELRPGPQRGDLNVPGRALWAASSRKLCGHGWGVFGADSPESVNTLLRWARELTAVSSAGRRDADVAWPRARPEDAANWR